MVDALHIHCYLLDVQCSTNKSKIEKCKELNNETEMKQSKTCLNYTRRLHGDIDVHFW